MALQNATLTFTYPVNASLQTGDIVYYSTISTQKRRNNVSDRSAQLAADAKQSTIKPRALGRHPRPV